VKLLALCDELTDRLRNTMYSSSSYSSSRSSIPSPYSLPYSSSSRSSYNRYRDYSDSRFGSISPYSTPNIYSSSRSRLTRGASLPAEPSVSLSPLLSERKKSSLSRQYSLFSDLDERGGRGESITVDPRDHTRTLDLHQQPRLHHQSVRSAFRERQDNGRPISCNKVCDGISIGNAESVLSIPYLKSIGATHVLNTAEQHVEVNPAELSKHGIQYLGFHVDDLPHCNISRHFHRTSEFLHRAVSGNGLCVVNCYMGLSRSSSCVIAYLMMKQDMSCQGALQRIKQHRNVRPNAGFLQQLADLEMSLAISGRRNMR